MSSTFNALYLDKPDDGFTCEIRELQEADLPEGDVLVSVDYSTINYKDGLAITGRPGVVRKWPMVPGIDLAGTVESSNSPEWKAGDSVTVNCWGLSETHWGGLSQKCRVPAGWLTKIPDAFSTKQAAAIGTAGYTAMLCIMALEEHGVSPDKDGKDGVLVTGAVGGVGSVAVSVLAKLGHKVSASTGRADTEGDYLKSLGAAEIIARDELNAELKAPMGSARWSGCVDPVGGNTLANVLAQMGGDGCVANCGLAGGPEFSSSVIPFILRGVSLIGINCVKQPAERRNEAWARLASDLNTQHLDDMTQEAPLAESEAIAADILQGKIKGRVVVDVNA